MRLEEIAAFTRDVNQELDRGLGVRIGETAVASRRVHILDPAHPEVMTVRCMADAGQVFYGRSKAFEVVHLDVFHALADIDHTAVALAVRHAAEEFAREMCIGPEPWSLRSWPSGNLADFVDVQTGTGGGRATGSLKFGRKASLRTAHRGHVHLAAMLPPDATGLIYYLVREVELAIRLAGGELRQVERVANNHSVIGSPLDLSPYSSQMDSLLREDNQPGSGTDRSAEMKDALDASADFGSVTSLRSFLECAASPNRRESPYAMLEREFGDAEGMLARLRALEIVDGDGASVTLSDKGLRIRDFLRRFAREVETQMHRLIRRAARPACTPLERSDFAVSSAGKAGHYSALRTMRADEADFRGEIAVPETVTTWAVRCAKSGEILPMQRDDVRIEQRRRRRKVDVCLLIDASASMAGKRIQAAKHLARYLFLACRDKVTVLTFQDRSVTCHVVRARSVKALEDGLATVRPAGLTPLAAGIVEAVRVLASSKATPTLLVLLTDGIPTMNQWTGDPARDALTAAEQIAKYGLPFTCIGLSPNKGFLRRLAEVAHGTLYIVDEFDRDLLAKVVRDERDRVQT